jgi:hypothetical protein
MTSKIASVEQREAMQEMAEVDAMEQWLIGYYVPESLVNVLSYSQMCRIVFEHEPEFAQRVSEAYSRAFASMRI